MVISKYVCLYVLTHFGALLSGYVEIDLMGVLLKALMLKEHLQITLETAPTLRSSDLMTGSVAPESARQKILDRRSW